MNLNEPRDFVQQGCGHSDIKLYYTVLVDDDLINCNWLGVLKCWVLIGAYQTENGWIGQLRAVNQGILHATIDIFFSLTLKK